MTFLIFILGALLACFLYVVLPLFRIVWRLIVKRIELTTIKSILYGQKGKTKETEGPKTKRR